MPKESKKVGSDDFRDLFGMQHHRRRAENDKNTIKTVSRRIVTIYAAFFTDGLWLVQEDILATAHSKVGFDLLHNFPLDMSKLLKG